MPCSVLTMEKCEKHNHKSYEITSINQFKLSTVWVKNYRPVACGYLTFFSQTVDNFKSFLHTYYTFLSTLDYKSLFNYLQLQRSYAIISATT